jgi:hypothetical protein
MNYLSDVLTYMRRLLKAPSNYHITDNLLIDYVNRFMIEINLRMELFDFKTKYGFQTIPGIADYNMPLYSIQTQPGSQVIGPFPIYEGFMKPAYCNGIPLTFSTERQEFFNIWPNYNQPQLQVATGDNTAGPYAINLAYQPIIPGHIDITGIIAAFNETASIEDPPFVNNATAQALIPAIPTTSINSTVYLTAIGQSGNNIIVQDSGLFLDGNTSSELYGILMQPGQAPNGNLPLTGTYSTTVNTVNYNQGTLNVTFPEAIPSGTAIQAQCLFFQQGIPRSVLYYNNTITLRNPPDIQYYIELDAYITPAAFLSTSQALQFGYMCEYIARGATRKIMADTGDIEQFQFYEPLFEEQQALVWKKSQRQRTATRTQTIYSNPGSQYQGIYNNIGMN